MFSVGLTKWKNWSETVVAYPESIKSPGSVDALRDIVVHCKNKGKTIRIVGAGHSFTPLAATSEILVNMDHLSGIDAIDFDNNLVTVWAGTTLKRLGEHLHELGYAMENLGDINAQTIAGAISTGTHGTGIKFGSISTQVTLLTILTPNGDFKEISQMENEAYFQAFRVSLGMLGMIIKVQLRVIPEQQLISESYRMDFDNCLSKLDDFCETNRHFEFFWFPYTKSVQVKQLNPYEKLKAKNTKRSCFNELVIENGVFKILSEICRLQPRLTRPVSNISALAIPNGKEIGDSHSMFATPRLVKFYEMEYSVPADKMIAVLRDIQHVLDKRKFRVHFPIECRYVKADDIWLSPAYGRDSAYIAVHMYKGMEFQAYFEAIEEVFQYYDGRPHWGKMHTMTPDKLEKVYPKFNDFLTIRSRLDPNGMLLNGYLRRLFAI